MKNGNIFWKKTEIISIQLVMVQLRFNFNSTKALRILICKLYSNACINRIYTHFEEYEHTLYLPSAINVCGIQ